MRDAIHERLPHLSKNKTSRACQRRINYILRNPTTLSNVNLFLAEVKGDAQITSKFPIPARGTISREQNENRLKKQFPLLLDILVEKFKRKDEDLESIPENLDTLKKRFVIQVPENHRKEEKFCEPSEIEDIKSSVICNIILSSLCCKNDKYNWAFHLFKVYQQYSDASLRKSLTFLRKARMVSVEKTAKSRSMENQAPPLTSNPYQLSVTFLHRFLSRYQNDLLHNIQKFANKTKLQETVLVPFGSEGGSAALLTSLASTGSIHFKIEIPEQVVILDPQLENEKLSQMMEKYKDIMNEDSGVTTGVVKVSEVLKGVKKDAKKPKNPGE